MMDYGFIGLVLSVVVNIGLVGYMLFAGNGPTAAQALAEFKAAVMKVKAAKDKASVDAVAFSAGIPQILEILNPKV